MKLIATASSDATVRIYKNRKLKNQQQFFHKFTIRSREEQCENDNQENINDNIKPVEDAPMEIPQQVEPKRKSHRLFLDDTEYTSFVRRLAWSPDGTFMLTPGSWYQDLSKDLSKEGEVPKDDRFQYTVYGFLKNSVNKPSFMLPGIKTHATCIKFCPFLLQLVEKSDDD